MKNSIIFLCTALLLTACGEKAKETPAVVDDSSISLSEQTLTAGPEGATFNVKVTSSGPWRVSGLSEWVSFSATEGQNGQDLTIQVAPNESEEIRSATYKVFTGSAVQALTIVSNPAFRLDLLSDGAMTVGPDATTVLVSLESNIAELEYDFGGASWISLREVSEALGKRIYKFDVARSAEFKDREGRISLSGEGLDVHVDLTQAQRDTAFVTEGKRIVKGLDAMDVTLHIQTNFDVNYTLDDWLSETGSSETEKDAATGLKTRTVTLHADASEESRAQNLTFYKGNTMSTTYGSVYIKQENPNPTYVEIEDGQLASQLQNMGWVLYDEGTGKSEVLKAGLTGTSINVAVSVVKISGLEAFPALETLSVDSNGLDEIDLKGCPKLSTLSLGTNCRNMTRVSLGSSPVEAVTLGSNHYFNSTSLTIAGDHITSVAVPCSSWYIMYGYDRLATLDVSGCPALKTLNAKRQYNSAEGPLRTIYMTQAQAESVEVTKNPSAEIVVK